MPTWHSNGGFRTMDNATYVTQAKEIEISEEDTSHYHAVSESQFRETVKDDSYAIKNNGIQYTFGDS